MQAGCGLFALPVIAGLSWRAALNFNFSVSFGELIASEIIWRFGILGINVALLVAMGTGAGLSLEVMNAEFVTYIRAAANGSLAIQSEESNIRECRRVRLALAEDLPFWARFAKVRKEEKELGLVLMAFHERIRVGSGAWILVCSPFACFQIQLTPSSAKFTHCSRLSNC